ncbi:MAG: bifunctional nuclease family protein [Chlamydiae bacterium]|nr:bifunctional nuclease family protein [Chlamydiota bacterium]MBI3267355.1 bifunctional nuclease family protein [Chlamydiota bacterium]
MKKAKINSLMLIPQIGQYVIVLEAIEDARLVPIWIGASEGSSIALQLQGAELPRPITHDLIVNLFKLFEVKLNKVIVSDLKDNTYFAILEVEANGKRFEIDSRPSDAIAIAVRMQTPLFIDEKVLEKCPKIERPISEEDVEKFRKDLQNISPEEFFKKLEDKD